MYYVSKRMEIAGAHRLNLTYDSKCGSIHGHNWIVTAHFKGEQLNDNGMIVDFSHVKRAIHHKLDHKFLNNELKFNPTAENIAKWCCDQFRECYKVEVQESEGNKAVYVKD